MVCSFLNLRRSLLVCAALSVAVGVVDAQEKFPSRTIKIVVGSGPGSAPDLLARVLAKEMGSVLGQSVVVENKAGAAGTIGAALVVNAPADGYTLLMGTVSNVALAPSFYSVKYDPVKDFTAIGMVASVPLMLVTSPNFSVTDFQQFTAKAKQTNIDLAYASPGIGGPQHLAGVLLQRQFGRPSLHVPYKSGAAAMTAVMSGDVQFAFAGIPAAASLAAGNKLVPLFVTSRKRSASMPDVPSAPEVGLQEFDIDNWHALLAPAQLPAATRSVIEAALQKALTSPAVKQQFLKAGAEPAGGTSKQMEAVIVSETARWAKFVIDNNLKTE